MTVATNNHITIDDEGVARIDGTRFKVIHLVKEMLARTASVQQLQATFPDLSLAKIHAALAYYYDHQGQIDAQIANESAEFASDQNRASMTPGREKLRDAGHRP